QGEAPASPSMSKLAAGYGAAWGVAPKDVLQAVQASRTKLRGLAEAIGLKLPPDSAAQRLMAQPADAEAGAAGADPAAAEAATLVITPHPSMPPALPASDVLTAGIQDITHTLAQESFRLNEVLRMILETIYRALGFRCVVFALRDPKSGTLTGRFGLGEGVQALVSQFAVPLGDGRTPAADLLAAVCQKGSDLLIADAAVAQVAKRLPPWLQRCDQARTFLLLPLVMKGATFALIYADRAQAGSIAASEKELSLLRTLRSQAVMAFRQVA
ncbi:MAG TPA: GAF domain-containing protein, partial [Burkholderiaceae bacterium]|nr:GAF domain-containing protein [Burkholderiaceae bacterium]